VFFAFRFMVGIGVAMIALSWLTAWSTRKNAAVPRWLLWTLAGSTFAGWMATLAGWIVTEIGRQPWLVSGLLRTSEAVGEITGAQLGVSLTGYVLTYAAMFVAYMVVLTHLAGAGAEAGAAKVLPGASPAGAAAD
jgi:cytochrome d ubiquinol oxidase subunit I